MQLSAIIILVLYGILGAVFVVVLAQVATHRREGYGRSTISTFWQITGKILIMIPIVYLPLVAIGWLRPPHATTLWLEWLAVFVAFEAMLFGGFALWKMGRFTKMGLPKNDDIPLLTTGIYSLSRNPMYLALYLLATAAVLYKPCLPIAVAALAGIIIHHIIILNEEKFLEMKFGQSYKNYRQRVRRYL
ncbi:MAG: isoprenylcysteine carboxylmethyltransferase family protein [Clostridia bacterium]|nr:isoprenylcysteine carboxylmethyltransferase family protein [Clostridia bacterium]